MHWQPKDVIAAIAVTGTLILLGMGINHTITMIFAAIIAAYVGLDITLTRRRK